MTNERITRTVTSSQLARNLAAALRAADESGTVIITHRGEPAFALLSISEYRRLSGTKKGLSDRLVSPEAGQVDLDIEPARIVARDIDG